jgi:hypothetical protein
MSNRDFRPGRTVERALVGHSSNIQMDLWAAGLRGVHELVEVGSGPFGLSRLRRCAICLAESVVSWRKTGSQGQLERMASLTGRQIVAGPMQPRQFLGHDTLGPRPRQFRAWSDPGGFRPPCRPYVAGFPAERFRYRLTRLAETAPRLAGAPLPLHVALKFLPAGGCVVLDAVLDFGT